MNMHRVRLSSHKVASGETFKVKDATFDIKIIKYMPMKLFILEMSLRKL
jgi:hypothetical protein